VCVSVRACLRDLETSQQGGLHPRWAAAPVMKGVPVHQEKAYGGAEVQLHLFLTSALDRREWAVFAAWPHYVMGPRSGTIK